MTEPKVSFVQQHGRISRDGTFTPVSAVTPIKIAVQDDDMMPVSQLINRWARHLDAAYEESQRNPERSLPVGTDMCRKSIPRFRVMEDFGLTVRAPNPVFGRHLV